MASLLEVLPSTRTQATRPFSAAVVNKAMLEFNLFTVQHDYVANPAESAIMDACVRDIARNQVMYGASTFAATFLGSTILRLPFKAPFNCLPLGARLVAAGGSAYFAADTGVLHATSKFLSGLIALPDSPLGDHLQRRCGLPRQC